MAESEKRRVSFDFSIPAYEELDRMRQAIGADNHAVVVRKALRLLHWQMEQESEGFRVQAVKDSEVREIDWSLDDAKEEVAVIFKAR